MFDLPPHPALVHLPLGVMVVVPLAALAILIGWRTGSLPRRAWWLAVGLQAVVVLGGLAAERTGEQDEERAEAYAAERVIEHHEELAETFVGASSALLALMTVTALVPPVGVAQALAATSVVVSLGTAGLGYQVGHAGGAIVYGDPAAPALASLGAPAQRARSQAHDDHDDDD